MEIFGWGSDRVGPITALERELRQWEEIIAPGPTPVDDIWPEADVYWGSLVGAWIGWDRSRRWSGSCGGRKRLLNRDQRMLDIFGLRPMSVGEVWLVLVAAQDIWSGSTSVEDVDALIEVPGRSTTLWLRR